MKHHVFWRFLCCLSFFASAKATADDTSRLSDSALVKRAESVLQDIHFQYDRSRELSIVRTNQMARIVFPRYFFRDQNPTNGPDHAAIVWLDESTGDILPNPDLVPLSDEQAVQIARACCRPEIFDHSSSNQVLRIASLTIVSVYPQPRQGPDGSMAPHYPSFFVWIDTETQFPFGVSMVPN